MGFSEFMEAITERNADILKIKKQKMKNREAKLKAKIAKSNSKSAAINKKAESQKAKASAMLEKEKAKEKKQARIFELVKSIENLKTSTKIVIICIIVVFVILCVCGFNACFKEKERTLTFSSTSTLEKVLEISELQALEYTYNGVARVYKEDENEIKYYVAYEGSVVAGIDFEKIDFKVLNEEKKILIIIPDAEVFDINIEFEKMQFIFKDSKYNNEKVSQEAYIKCIEDIQKRTATDVQLIEIAEENATSAIRALFEPWIKQIDDEFTIEIVKDNTSASDIASSASDVGDE